MPKSILAGEVEVKDGKNNSMYLNQTSQTKHLKFAFVAPKKSGLTAFHPLVKCRDYLTDVIHTKAVKTTATVYGFMMSPETNILDESCTRLLLDFSNQEALAQFTTTFPVVQRAEEEIFEVSSIKLFAVKNNTKRLYLEADKLWQLATHRVSMLTLLCRATMYMQSHKEDWLDIGSMSGNDAQYVQWLKDFHVRDKLPHLKNLDPSKARTPSGFSKDAEIYEVHDCGGFISLICNGEQQLQSAGFSQKDTMKKNTFYNQLQSMAG